jgi:hypothetical protein
VSGDRPAASRGIRSPAMPVRGQAVATVSGIPERISAGARRLRRGRRIALRRSGLHSPSLALAKRRPSGPRTAQRKIAVRSKRERIELRGGVARRRRALRGMKFRQRAPLTTRCECRTLFPSRPSFGRSNLHWRQFALASGGSSLSLADALRRRPRRHHRPHRCIARDVAGLTKRSSMARSISSALLLLYGLPLRRSLLLRSGFRLRLNLRCRFLRHVALLAKLSWRCRISDYANRRHCIPITTAQRKKQLPD